MSESLVVVTGADTPTGLSTARAIKRTGLKITGALVDTSAPAVVSRLWDHQIQVSGEPEQQLEQILSWAENQKFSERPLLLFSQDSHVLAAWEMESELRKYFVMPLPVREKGELMMDKTRFYQWAKAHGVAVPESRVVTTQEELAEEASALRYPIILKPMVRTSTWDMAFKDQKFFKLKDEQELAELVKSTNPFQFSQRYVLQEWIPGGDSDIFFVLFAFDEASNLLTRVGGRKIWQWPPLGGSTAMCQLWHTPELLELGESIVRDLGMIGLGSIEFKRDPRDGRFLVTEPTVGRNNYQSGVATLMHLSPTEALVRRIFKLPEVDHNEASYLAPKGLWIDELSVWRYLKLNGIFRGIARVIWMLITLKRVRYLHFSLRDPRPFVKHFLQSIRRRRK